MRKKTLQVKFFAPMNNLSEIWFKDTFGFEELDFDRTKEQFVWDNGVLTSLSNKRSFDVGPFENIGIQVAEVDDASLVIRSDLYSERQLGVAIIRLYEWYAESLFESVSAERAHTTAKAITAMKMLPDVDALRTVLTADVQMRDYRHKVSTWSAEGAEGVVRHFDSLKRLESDIALHDLEVLCLQLRGAL